MSNLARELQDTVRKHISDKISDTSILSEDQKDIEYEIKNALGKQGIVTVVMTPKMSYIGHDGKYLVWQVDELTIMTTEYVPVNRAKNKESYKSGFDLAFEINDILAGPNTDIGFGKFCPITVEQGEDSGLLVTKSTFSTTIQFYDEPVPPPVPTTGGKMTADFSDEMGNPVVAFWNNVGWDAMMLGYTLHIEYVNGRWTIDITNSHGGKWTLESNQDPSDKVISFSGDNPLRINQTWTWSE